MQRVVSEEEARSFGEESFGREIEWGDVIVSAVGGEFYASAFVSPSRGMHETLPLLSDLDFVYDYIEAPSAARFAKLRANFIKRRERAKKAVAIAKKLGDERATRNAQAELERAERGLLRIEVSASLAARPGCISRYILTTARAASREEAVERVRQQVKKILFRTGGTMLRESEIKRCFGWEEATGDSIERASHGRALGAYIVRELKRLFGG